MIAAKSRVPPRAERQASAAAADRDIGATRDIAQLQAAAAA